MRSDLERLMSPLFELSLRRAPVRHFTFACALTIGTLACGGGDSPMAPSTPPPAGGGGSGTPPPTSVTVTIASGGVTPNDFVLAVGGTITWVNNDNVVHDLSSDPHPQHTDCPPLNAGDLNPGQRRTTAALTTARVCRFHDHLNPGAAGLMGRVTIQ